MSTHRSLEHVSTTQQNPWRRRLSYILAAGMTIAVANRACHTNTVSSAPASSTVSVQSRSPRSHRSAVRMFSLPQRAQLTSPAQLLFPLSPLENVGDGQMLLPAVQHPSSADSGSATDLWADDYMRRSHMAALDLEATVLQGGSVPVDRAHFRSAMIDTLANDYDMLPPTDPNASRDPETWHLGEIGVECHMDILAFESTHRGDHTRAIQIAAAGGSISTAVDLALRQNHLDVALGAVAARLQEIHSDAEWVNFFAGALALAPELFQILYDSFSVQQVRCALVALAELLVRGQANMPSTDDKSVVPPEHMPHLNPERESALMMCRRYQAMLDWYHASQSAE